MRRNRFKENIKRYPIRFREDIGPYITIGGKKYPLDASKYDPRLGGDEVIDRFDREYKADEEDIVEKARKADLEKRTKDIIAKNKELLSGKSNYTDKFNTLFEEYVPGSGKSDSLGGEIIRAVSKIGYRWYNDGDVYFTGYGKETCGPAAKFLVSRSDEDHEYLEDIGDFLIEFADDVSDNGNFYSPESLDKYIDKEYEGFINGLIKLTVDTVTDHPELFLEDTADMYESDKIEDEFSEPKFDYSLELPYTLKDYLDAEVITELDIRDYIENALDWMTEINYEDIECNMYDCGIYGLDYDSYMELDDAVRNGSFFDDYIEDLKSEYGDPDDLEDEEEEEEEDEEEDEE